MSEWTASSARGLSWAYQADPWKVRDVPMGLPGEYGIARYRGVGTNEEIGQHVLLLATLPSVAYPGLAGKK